MTKKKKLMMGILFVILAVGILQAMTVYKQQRLNEVSYNQFVQKLEAYQVEEATVSNQAKMTFKLKGDDRTYTTDNPRKENFKEELLLHQVEVKEGSQTAANGMQQLFSTLVIGAMFYIVFRGVKKTGGITSGMKLNTQVVEASELKMDFSHIAGNVEAKEQVQDVIDFIKNPQRYTKLGARMPKGLIFYGPPGTGKTLMAKAIAKEAGVAFFSVSGSDFVQMYVGVGASRVREIFKEARKHQKAVIFIDEIDALGKKRSQNAGESNDEKDQTLNALLTEMSGFKEDEGIIVVAATNRLDMLDEALLRPGRFDRHIEIGYPDLKAREAIIRLHLKNKPISEEVSVSDLAKQTVLFTGAMLENLLNEAAIMAANEKSEYISNAHIETAFYTVIAGKEKKDRSQISEVDRQITAYHEAGHALVTKIVAPENSVTKVTIIPSTKGAGGFSMNVPKDRMYLTKKDLIARIQISLAGRAAEELIFGKEYITTGASNDIEKASMDMKNYLIKYGMDEEFGLVNLETIMGNATMEYEGLIEKCRKEIKKLYEETINLISKNEERLREIANQLLEKETLNEKEIASFFQ